MSRFTPPKLPKVHVYFGRTGDVKKLHDGENLSTRLEEEISIHQGQIEAENLLINSVANYMHAAQENGVTREDFNQILRDSHYHLNEVKSALLERGVPKTALEAYAHGAEMDTADMMRQRAAMMGSVLSSTPVLLRDPWDGKPTTRDYGFSDFKAEVDGVSFSAIATPRFEGIPFRFAVMKHEHDGFNDNNPAMIMSNEFCDAFEQYNKERGGNMPPEEHPLLVSMATSLKPNIHDRFHNWLLYDLNAASDVFKEWGNDIYFVDHRDKNPLLINYEQVAMCFHLYAYQTLFDKNPGFKDHLYEELERSISEIHKFGEYLRETPHPKADALESSTVYAVLSNIGFVLDPFEERFQKIMEPYPAVKEKLLDTKKEGKGIGKTLERLHGYEDGIPSQRYGGAREATIEYILRYPLAEEMKARISRDRGAQIGELPKLPETMKLAEYEKLAPQLRGAHDPSALTKIHEALDALPKAMQAEVKGRIEVSPEGYFFLRLERDEPDLTAFEVRKQQKKVLLIDIPKGREVRFSNEKKLSIKDKVLKQEFHLVGGRDLLAINLRDKDAAQEVLDAARTSDGSIDPDLAIAKAKELALIIGDRSAGDMYTLRREVAEKIYDFSKTGFYERELEKSVACSPGPVVLKLNNGDDQRLVKGAFVHLPLGKDPATDHDPDLHVIENTDYKRDYASRIGTDELCKLRLKNDSPLMSCPEASEALNDLLSTLHQVNFQITHGATLASTHAKGGKGLFS